MVAAKGTPFALKTSVGIMTRSSMCRPRLSFMAGLLTGVLLTAPLLFSASSRQLQSRKPLGMVLMRNEASEESNAAGGAGGRRNALTMPNIVEGPGENLHLLYPCYHTRGFELANASRQVSTVFVNPNASAWQAWVINLESARARLRNMQNQVAGSDFPSDLPLQRLAAVNASTLHLPSILTPTALAELQRTQQVGHRTAHYQLTFGSVGTYMSMVKAWKALGNSSAEAALILEDDVVLKSSFWGRFMAHPAPADWDILLLGAFCHCCSRDFIPGTRYRKATRFWGLHAYAISAKAARKLVDEAFPMAQQMDSLVSEMAARGQLHVYMLSETLAWQATKAFGSSQTETKGPDVWALAPPRPQPPLQ